MFTHGAFGIRIRPGADQADVKTVHYWYRRNGKPSNRGIDGGKIDLLRLTIKDDITGWFSAGRWYVPVEDEWSREALRIVLTRWN